MSEVKQIWIATDYSDNPRGPFDVIKGTPAKWFYRRSALFDGSIIEGQVFKDGRGHEKPFLSEADALSFIADSRSERKKQDAKRLAERAGPALLEALEAYLDAEEIDEPAMREIELLACRQQARAAIARAKGGE